MAEAPTRGAAPPDQMEAYRAWLRTVHRVDPSYSDYYGQVQEAVRGGIGSSGAWAGLPEALRNWNDAFRLKTSYELTTDFAPQLLLKSWPSFLEKTFRLNTVANRRYPRPPRGGWVIPPAWFGRINDVARTRVVVRYLDGVTFMADRLGDYFEGLGLPLDIAYEARGEGYHAVHCYTRIPVEVPRRPWDTEIINISLEIQITTQLQDLLNQLLHGRYERRRMRPSNNNKWQWEFRGDEFTPNYLGHIAQFLEGMIVQVRDQDGDGNES